MSNQPESVQGSAAHMRSRLTEDKALRAEMLCAYQVAASTALAEASRFIESGNLDLLSSFVSWTHTAESERNKIKGTVGW